MRLTAYSNFAPPTLQMAALRAPALARVDEVARAHGLSRAHITKIVHEPGRTGFLETQRGRGGGFRLARPAERIVVGDVVRLTEGPVELVECFNPATNTCPLLGICRLSRALSEATSALFAVLDALTIADIAANRAALLDRLDAALASGAAPEVSAADRKTANQPRHRRRRSGVRLAQVRLRAEARRDGAPRTRRGDPLVKAGGGPPEAPHASPRARQGVRLIENRPGRRDRYLRRRARKRVGAPAHAAHDVFIVLVGEKLEIRADIGPADVTWTGLKKPARARCANPRASFRSVLCVARVFSA